MKVHKWVNKGKWLSRSPRAIVLVLCTLEEARKDDEFVVFKWEDVTCKNCLKKRGK